MGSTTIYLIFLVISSLYIFIPMIGRSKDSIEMSTFLMGIGYGGYTLSKKNVTNTKAITREEYLNKSFVLQSIIGVINIAVLALSYISSINIIVTVLILIMINIVSSFIFWRNIRAFTIQ